MPMDKKRILVVDDENDIVDLLKARLEANYFEVISAANGEEALKMIKTAKPDAVLLDILMPRLNGLEVLKEIRKRDKDLPVYMVTAFTDEEKFKVARELGASDFIVKTCDLKEEISNITNALRMADKRKGKTDDKIG